MLNSVGWLVWFTSMMSWVLLLDLDRFSGGFGVLGYGMLGGWVVGMVVFVG